MGIGLIDIARWDFAGMYYDAPIHSLFQIICIVILMLYQLQQWIEVETLSINSLSLMNRSRSSTADEWIHIEQPTKIV
jgi:hypothetical protein